MAKDRTPARVAELHQKLGAPDATLVDQLYGLEPVFEPAESAAALGQYVEFLCPWCCENVGTSIDLTAGAHSAIEDCQVCCQPFELTVELDSRGELKRLDVQRVD
jgi:hypothetical protein